MPSKRSSKKPQDDVELTDVDTDSDTDLQPVRLPHGLPLDEPPPCLPLSSHAEVEQVCQQHLSNGYIPMSVFPWRRSCHPSSSVPRRSHAAAPTMVFSSGAYYHAGSVGINSDQYQEVPMDLGSSCSQGSSMHAYKLFHRLAAAQRSRRQVQSTRLLQRAGASFTLSARRAVATRRTRTRPIPERTTSRTQPPCSPTKFGV